VLHSLGTADGAIATAYPHNGTAAALGAHPLKLLATTRAGGFKQLLKQARRPKADHNRSKNFKGAFSMRKRKNPCCLCAAATLAIIILALHPLVGLAFEDTSATQAVSYSFISIDIPNSSGDLGFTSLADINNDGEITGGFTNSSGFGFLLGETFRSTDIQCSGGTNAVLNAQPQSISKRGEIVGFCFTGGRLHSFFRSKKGKYTLLDFPSALLTEAVGINDDGQVVGDYRDSAGRFHGFFWDAGLFLTIDVPFPEATLTSPNGINNVGQIVGFYDDNTGGRHGFLYDRGNFISFDLPGSRLTAPTDINDDGQIVGVYVADDDVPQSLFEKYQAASRLSIKRVIAT